MEMFDWKKWFTGFIDPTRILKDAGTLIRMAIILGICFAVYLGIKEVRIMFQPKKAQPVIDSINTTTGSVESKIDASLNAKKTQKNALINFF